MQHAACFMMSTWSSNRHQTLLTVLSHNCISAFQNISTFPRTRLALFICIALSTLLNHLCAARSP